MNREAIETSIGSYENREKQAVKEARNAINDDLYAYAAKRLVEAQGYKQAVDELKFILEVMEAEQ